MNNNFSVANVVYISHDSKNVCLFMSDGSRRSDDVTYYHIIRMLNDNFVRVNKNIIVNLEYATRIDGKSIVLINDSKFNIEKEYEKSATNKFYGHKFKNFLSE